MKATHFIVLVMVLIGSACGHKKLRPIDYVKWFENEKNGLRAKRAVGDFEFTAQYKSVDYVIAQEEKSNSIPKDIYNSRRENLEGYVYVNLLIKSTDGKTPVLQNRTTPEGYYERINYFLTGATQDFWIIQGRDTMDCTLCHFEQNYGLAAENFIVLVFKPRIHEDLTEDMILVYDDKVLNVGQIRIKIPGSSFENLPVMQAEG